MAIAVQAVRVEGRAGTTVTSVGRAVLWTIGAVPGVLAVAGCGLQGIVDDFGFVGSGGGHEELGDGGADDSSSRRDGAGLADSEADAFSESSEPEDSAGQEIHDAAIEDGGTGTGVVAVEAGLTLEEATPIECPGISVFSVNPAGLVLGQQSQLTVATIGPPASIRWSVSPPSGGKISSPSALAPTFECLVPEPATVTVTASPAEGGSCAGVRFTSYSAAIDCQK